VYYFKSGISEDDLDEMALWQRVRATCIERNILHLAAKDYSKATMNADIISSIAQYHLKYDKVDAAVFIEPEYVTDENLASLLHDGGSVQGQGIKTFNPQPVKITKYNLPRAKPTYYFCKIKVRDELVFAHRLIPREAGPKKEHARIAFLIPSKNDHADPATAPLFKNFFKSLSKSIAEKENDAYELLFYIGFDGGDPLLDILEFEDSAIRMTRLPRTRWLTFIWNRLYDEAHRDGCDVFIQVNDDLTFLGQRGWLTLVAHKILDEGYQVVGLNDDLWQCQLYTQAAVSRKHHAIFNGHMYPLSLCNWYSDTWLTFVYPRSTCVKEALVKNSSGSTRYQHCTLSHPEFVQILLNSRRLLGKA